MNSRVLLYSFYQYFDVILFSNLIKIFRSRGDDGNYGETCRLQNITMTTLTTNVNNSTPRVVAVFAGAVAVYLVTLSGGIGVGVLLCISPLFTSFNRIGTGATISNETQSHILTETDLDELQLFREEEHSIFGRILHQTIQICNLDELVFVVCILRENRGLLILLLGGITSMMMALLAGLEDVNILRAFLLSITCYGITTVLVARSARAVLDGSSTQSKKERMSCMQLKDIMESIPTERFVSEEEMRSCDSNLLITMLQNRFEKPTKNSISSQAKQSLINSLYQKRNYNEDCCICLSTFENGQTIRVLPRCHHEFHKCCIDKWALTFATNRYEFNSLRKRGKPTCPLCNTALVARDQSELVLSKE